MVRIVTALLIGAASSGSAYAWECDRDAGQRLYFYEGTDQSDGQYLTRSKKIATGNGPTVTLICEGADEDQEPLVKRCDDDVGKVQITWFEDDRVESHCIPNSATTERAPERDDDADDGSNDGDSDDDDNRRRHNRSGDDNSDGGSGDNETSGSNDNGSDDDGSGRNSTTDN